MQHHLCIAWHTQHAQSGAKRGTLRCKARQACNISILKICVSPCVIVPSLVGYDFWGGMSVAQHPYPIPASSIERGAPPLEKIAWMLQLRKLQLVILLQEMHHSKPNHSVRSTWHERSPSMCAASYKWGCVLIWSSPVADSTIYVSSSACSCASHKLFFPLLSKVKISVHINHLTPDWLVNLEQSDMMYSPQTRVSSLGPGKAAQIAYAKKSVVFAVCLAQTRKCRKPSRFGILTAGVHLLLAAAQLTRSIFAPLTHWQHHNARYLGYRKLYHTRAKFEAWGPRWGKMCLPYVQCTFDACYTKVILD